MTSPLYHIACDSLERCIIDGRLVASPTHYADYWARDTFFAFRGIVRAGYHELAKSSLQLFFDYQRADGKIPRKIAREYAPIKYATGKKVSRSRPVPIYRGVIPPFHSMDDNALAVIGMRDYVVETHDLDYAVRQYGATRSALRWYEAKKRHGLIEEWFFANWMDSVIKVGAVLYTNVLYVQALWAMRDLARMLEYEHDAARLERLATEQSGRVRDRFWGEGVFRDEAEEHVTVTATAGNLMAVAADIADPHQMESVLSEIRTLRRRVLLSPQEPRYAPWRINPLMHMIGAGDYHNGASWLWIDILHLKLERELGEAEIADDIEATISDIVTRDGEVGETYFVDGTPYWRRFWQTATPFAWSSGMLLEYLSRSE